jgi:lycopene cyclase domain-containing protein
MATYTFYNLCLAVLILAVSYAIAGRNRRRILMLSARVGLLITVLLYPWDFFAVQLGVWTYPKDPGLRIYGVPLNDSIFIWLCTFLACVALLTTNNWRSRGDRNSVHKKTYRHRPKNNGY